MDSSAVLVTGAAGFVGRHLVPRLIETGRRTVSLVRRRRDYLPADQVEGDLLDAGSLRAIGTTWDAVIHLAGDTQPRDVQDGQASLRNAQMLLNLCAQVTTTKMIVASSAHVYGDATTPHSEDELPRPGGWYGLSKVLLEDTARFCGSTGSVRIVRAFNQLGPFLRPSLLVPTICKKLDELVANGSIAPLELQGRDSVRDFVDVRDVVRAYLAILDIESPGVLVVNACTGQGHTVRELAQEILRARGDGRDVVFRDRPGSADDVPVLVGSPKRLQSLTGWRSTIPLEDTVRFVLAAQ